MVVQPVLVCCALPQVANPKGRLADDQGAALQAAAALFSLEAGGPDSGASLDDDISALAFAAARSGGGGGGFRGGGGGSARSGVGGRLGGAAPGGRGGRGAQLSGRWLPFLSSGFLPFPLRMICLLEGILVLSPHAMVFTSCWSHLWCGMNMYSCVLSPGCVPAAPGSLCSPSPSSTAGAAAGGSSRHPCTAGACLMAAVPHRSEGRPGTPSRRRQALGTPILATAAAAGDGAGRCAPAVTRIYAAPTNGKTSSELPHDALELGGFCQHAVERQGCQACGALSVEWCAGLGREGEGGD